MTAKEIVKEVIDSLPDEVSLDEIRHALFVREKVERADKEFREGKGIPHEEAMKRLDKWLK
jgi:hypothetical protein